MAKKYFELDNLSVGYGKNILIKDICFGIEKGEIVTLIGPNGAGKSTILKSITRHLETMGGQVFFDDSNLKDISYKELSKKMAVVLTDRLKPELMTCHDIVATGRYPYTGRLGILSHEDEDKVDAALSAVNAVELGARDFNAISDGQKQRILLARAICQEPSVIVLDEPTSFLDIRYKLELLSILRRMAKESGITIIMTLHEIDLAQKVSDKIVCVSGNHIINYGTPEDIFKKEVITELYGIDNGFYDPVFGSIELVAPDGDRPKVFVISSGGTGIKVFRNLQKENIPFAAGILCKNDIDYELAQLLSCRVITEKSFSNISDATMESAIQTIKECDKVIYAGVEMGDINRKIKVLLALAEKENKLEDLTK